MSECEHSWLGRTGNHRVEDHGTSAQMKFDYWQECVKCGAVRDMSKDKHGAFENLYVDEEGHIQPMRATDERSDEPV